MKNVKKREVYVELPAGVDKIVSHDMVIYNTVYYQQPQKAAS